MRLLFFKSAAALAFLFVASVAGAHEYKLGALEILHPWTRATPGAATVAGAFLGVKNEGAEDDRLIAASAEAAGRVSIHETASTDGIMTMRPLRDGALIPAHGELSLKPGAIHLMLEELRRPLKEGERVKGSLTFARAGTIAVEFAVEAAGAGAPKAADAHVHQH